MNKIMMFRGGSPAIHKLGDIGREDDDLIRVHSEDEEYYIGSFEEGYGFIDVSFKKSHCRPLTEEERDKLNGSWYGINGTPLYRVYVDKDGNVVNGKVTTVKGKIEQVRDHNGNDKDSPFINMEVEFGEDVVIGKSLMMMTKEGYITTSHVTDVDVKNNLCIVYTKNSVYYIKII